MNYIQLKNKKPIVKMIKIYKINYNLNLIIIYKKNKMKYYNYRINHKLNKNRSLYIFQIKKL